MKISYVFITEILQRPFKDSFSLKAKPISDCDGNQDKLTGPSDLRKP